MEDWLSAKELAERLKISLETVRRLTRAKKIPAIAVGANYRYKMSEVERELAIDQTRKSPLVGGL